MNLAGRVRGIDVILGGHTHDAVPQPIPVTNAGGTTLVTNAGSNAKFLGVLDLDLARGRVGDIRYRPLPVFSELLKPDPAMAALIEAIRARMLRPTPEKSRPPIAALPPRQFPRSRGSTDLQGATQRIRCRDRAVAGFPLGPKLSAGTTPDDGRSVVRDRDQLSRNLRPEHDRQPDQGRFEDVCDNLFNADPYYQQDGDMVRVGGFTYTCRLAENIGRRISDLKLDNGRSIEAGKNYKVASWASINEQRGMPVWDLFAKYLGSGKTLDARGDGVTLSGVDGNPGIAGHG